LFLTRWNKEDFRIPLTVAIWTFLSGFVVLFLYGSLSVSSFVALMVAAGAGFLVSHYLFNIPLFKLLNAFAGRMEVPPGKLHGIYRQIYEAYKNVVYQLGQEWELYRKLYSDFAEVLDSLNIAIAIIDDSFQIKIANKAFKEYFLERHNTKAKDFRALMKRSGFRFSLEDGNYEIYSRRLKKRFLVSIVRKNKGWIVSFSDVTAYWKTKRLLEKTRKYAVSAESVADLAHGLKQPLATIQLTFDMYIRTKDEKYLEQLKRNLSEFREKIAAVLQLYHFGEDFGEVNLKDLLERIMGYMSSIAESRKVHLSCRYHGDGKIQVQAHRLENVLKNLILNAIEACENVDDASVTVKLREGSDIITVIICDNGPGIEPKNAEKIFKIFFTTKPQGTGLGLALAKSFCEDNGVILRFKSIPGKGTVFSLTMKKVE